MIRREVKENGVKISYGLNVYDVPEKMKKHFNQRNFDGDLIYEIKVFDVRNGRKMPLTIEDRDNMIYRDLITQVKMAGKNGLYKIDHVYEFDKIMFSTVESGKYGFNYIYTEVMEG